MEDYEYLKLDLPVMRETGFAGELIATRVLLDSVMLAIVQSRPSVAVSMLELHASTFPKSEREIDYPHIHEE